jgi:GTP-binding protein EngB required for normal cell division
MLLLSVMFFNQKLNYYPFFNKRVTMDLRPTINVAIMGCVSAGKSTLLNMLMTNMFSDCHRKRTTTMPQIYREITKSEEKSLEEKNPKEFDRSMSDLEAIRNANTQVNEEMKEQAKSGVAMVLADIKPLEYLVPKIKGFAKLVSDKHGNDVTLAIHDLPGLNDSISKKTYFEYIRQNFHIYDIVIFVVDVNSAMNTSDEVDILNLILEGIKKNNAQNLKTKLLIVINKCDALEITKANNMEPLPEDEELLEMYQQCRDIITVRSSEFGMSEPNFACISCEDAFVYRMAQAKQFDTLDAKYINRIGQLEFPAREWKKWDDATKKTKVKVLFKKEGIDDGLKMSGFEHFTKVINKMLLKPQQYEFAMNHINETLVSYKPNGNTMDIEKDLKWFQAIKIKIMLINNLFKTTDYDFTLLDNKLKSFTDEHMKYLKSTPFIANTISDRAAAKAAADIATSAINVSTTATLALLPLMVLDGNDADNAKYATASTAADIKYDNATKYSDMAAVAAAKYTTHVKNLFIHKRMCHEFAGTGEICGILNLYIRELCIIDLKDINQSLDQLSRIIQISINEKIYVVQEILIMIMSLGSHIKLLRPSTNKDEMIQEIGYFKFIMGISLETGITTEDKLRAVGKLVLSDFADENYNAQMCLLRLLENYDDHITPTDTYWPIFRQLKLTVFTNDQVMDTCAGIECKGESLLGLFLRELYGQAY